MKRFFRSRLLLFIAALGLILPALYLRPLGGMIVPAVCT